MYDNYFARTRAVRRTALVSRRRVCARHGARSAGTRRLRRRTSSPPRVIRKISGAEREARADDQHQPHPHAGQEHPARAGQQSGAAGRDAALGQPGADLGQEGRRHAGQPVGRGRQDPHGRRADLRRRPRAVRRAADAVPAFLDPVYRYSESLVLTGFVDRPDHVGPIMRLAEDYAPKVINNINVGGVQQILLKVKVMEVSRTKLRELGVDWACLGRQRRFLRVNSVSGIAAAGRSSAVAAIQSRHRQRRQTFAVRRRRRQRRVLRFPRCLAGTTGRQDSGRAEHRGRQRPAGPVQRRRRIPDSCSAKLGHHQIEFKPFGTQVDFLPIVLGNGNIRLEVRPRVSEIDADASVTLNGIRSSRPSRFAKSIRPSK